MLGVERQIQEERLVPLLANPVHGAGGIGIGGVEGVVVDRGDLFRHAGVDEVGRVEERSVGHRAVELVEPAGGGDELLAAAQVPFAYAGGGVPERLHAVGDRLLVHREAEVVFPFPPSAVELVPEAGGVAAGQQPGPARAAVRRGDVPAGEPHAVLGDRVDVRRRDLFVPLEAEFAVADVVGEEYDHVRLRFAVGGEADRSEECYKGEGREQSYHGSVFLQVSTSSVSPASEGTPFKLQIQEQALLYHMTRGTWEVGWACMSPDMNGFRCSFGRLRGNERSRKGESYISYGLPASPHPLRKIVPLPFPALRRPTALLIAVSSRARFRRRTAGSSCDPRPRET